MEYGQTAYNKRLTLRRPFGRLGVQSARSWLKPFPRLLHPHNQPPQTYGLLYMGAGYVVNLERYVQFALNWSEIY